MGNLGLYLWLTRVAKKLGGPIWFVAALMVGGALVGHVLIALIKRVAVAIKKTKGDVNSEPVYTVLHDTTGEEGIELKAGDQFRILLRDGEYALVERIRDEEHHILSMDTIKKITDCPFANLS